MGSANYLHVAGAGWFRQRAASAPESQNRYVSVGGFVNIEDLTKEYEAKKARRQNRQIGLFGSVSPRSRASRTSPTSEDARTKLQDWESVPTTPYEGEGRLTPLTPQTPLSAPKQTELPIKYCQTPHTTPPPVSRYSRHGRDLCVNVSPGSICSPREGLLYEFCGGIGSHHLGPQVGIPIELEGSLLLPSQGFSQPKPPNAPRGHKRSLSTPVDSPLSRSLPTITANDTKFSAPETHDIPLTSMAPAPILRDPGIPKRYHRRENSRVDSNSEQDLNTMLPMRKSSLRPEIPAPPYGPPPIPLSRMTIEELMQILPSLDAAIVAHDWVPCMQKRHHELKGLLQRMQGTTVAETSSNHSEEASRLLPFLSNGSNIEQGLEKLIDQSHDIAKTYYKLFDIAKDLQKAEMYKKETEIDEAYAQRSEAMIALARNASSHREVCQSYDREMQQFKDITRQSFDTLGRFIQQNLDDAMKHAPQQQVQQIIEILRASNEQKDLPIRHVSSELYHETQKALKKAYEDKRNFQEICSEQLVTIKNQSRELDECVGRMERIAKRMRDKKEENRKLKAEIDQLRMFIEAREGAMRVDNERELKYSQPQETRDQVRSDRRNVDQEIWVRDAEIANLRTKLDAAIRREKELQAHVRSLPQTTQADSAPNRSSRLKRLLVGGSRASPNLPTLNSMHNLSQSIFTPFEKEKPQTSPPPSPTKSVMSSPSLAGPCDPTTITHLELPPPQYLHSRSKSSGDAGPRLREGVCYSQDCIIDSTVTGRFYHMPSHVRPTLSTTRLQTTRSNSNNNNNSEVSSDDPAPRSRPRLNSAPEALELDAGSTMQEHTARDRYPLVNHQRVLSGITEVTEDAVSVMRKSSSLDSVDKRIYLDSMQALGRL